MGRDCVNSRRSSFITTAGSFFILGETLINKDCTFEIIISTSSIG